MADRLHEGLLLNMFIERMKVELEAQAIAAIRPAVKAAVVAVVAEMQPQIQAMSDEYKHRMVVELITREVKDHV